MSDQWNDQYDEMDADQLRAALRAQQQQEQDAAQTPKLDGIENLSQFEREALEAEARKVQSKIEHAISEKSRQSAESKLHAELEAWKQETGMLNVPVHIVEEKKREMRAGGIQIW